MNELFFVRNLPVDGSSTSLVISNRWGKQIFSSNNYYYTSESDNSLWDGGDDAEGVYFYSLAIDGVRTYSGWVEVLRGSRKQ
jgi:hypothetical protein